MGRTIAEGEVRVSLEDGRAIAGLKRVEAATHKTMQAIDREKANPQIDIDTSKFRTEMAYVQSEISRLDKKRAKAQVEIDVDGHAEAVVQIEKLEKKLSFLQKRYGHIGINIDVDNDKLKLSGLLIGAMTRRMDAGAKGLTGFADGIRNAGVRLGPLTLRLKTLIPTLGALAPIVTAAAGSLGALASVAYTGLIGALAGATAGAAQFAFGLGGVIGVVAPLVKDIGKAQKEIAKYDKAVESYGKNSKQAANAQERMNRVMGHTTEGTREAVRSIGQLGPRWRRLTADARGGFFELIGDGVRTANKLMPLFARESVKSFDVARKGTQAWLKGLRGPEAQNIFRNIFAGFRENLPNLMGGIGNIVTAIGRIAVASSGVFRRFSSWFKGMTQGWSDSTKDSGKLKSRMDEIGDSAAKVGKLFGAAGRLMHNIFSAGSDAGEGMITQWTSLLDKWATWANTARGQQQINQFFEQGANTLAKIASFLGKTVQLLVTLAGITRPWVNALIDVLNALIKTKGIAVGLSAVFIGMFAVSKGLAFAGVLMKIISLLKVMRTAGIAAAAAQAMGGAAGAAGGIAAGLGMGAGGKAAAQTSKLWLPASAAMGAASTKAGLLSMGLRGVGMAALRVAGPVGLAATAFLLVNKYVAKGEKDWTKWRQETGRARDATAQFNQVLSDAPSVMSGMASATQTARYAQREYNATVKQYGRGSQEARAAAFQLMDARRQESAASKQAQQFERKGISLLWEGVTARQHAFQEAKRQGVTQESLTEQYKRYQIATYRAIGGTVNLARVYRGLAPVAAKAALNIGRVVKAAGSQGNKVQRMFIRADTGDVEKAVRLMGRLQSMGQGSRAVKILANSDSIEEAIGKLKRLKDRAAERLKAKVDIDANDKATPKVERARRNAERLGNLRPVTVLEASDKATRKALRVIAAANRTKGPWSAELTANVQQAMAAIASANAAGQAFDGKTWTAYAKIITTKKPPPGTRGPGGFDGGMFINGIKAFAEGGMFTRGEKVSSPKFLVGEEFRPEFVIATNPAYRRRNIGLLKSAADALGVEMFAKGTGPTKSEKKAAANKRKAARIVKRQRKQARKQKRVQRRVFTSRESYIRPINEDERLIAEKEGMFDQDQRAYDIQDQNLDYEIEHDDGSTTPHAANIRTRVGHLNDLIGKKNYILTLYRSLASKIRAAVAKDGAIARAEKRYRAELKRVQALPTRGAGSVSKSQKNVLIQRAKDNLVNVRNDRTELEPRLAELGDDSKGEVRDKLLDIDELTSERDTLAGTTGRAASGSGAGGGDADSEAQLAQANLRAQVAETALAISEATLGVFRGPGDISYGGGNAYAAAGGASGPQGSGMAGGASASAATAQAYGGGGSVSSFGAGGPSAPAGGAGGDPPAAGGGSSITINTLHPADPATLQAIADASNAGNGYQGSQAAPRQASGY